MAMAATAKRSQANVILVICPELIDFTISVTGAPPYRVFTVEFRSLKQRDFPVSYGATVEIC